jgi:hypothetical protein
MAPVNAVKVAYCESAELIQAGVVETAKNFHGVVMVWMAGDASELGA